MSSTGNQSKSRHFWENSIVHEFVSLNVLILLSKTVFVCPEKPVSVMDSLCVCHRHFVSIKIYMILFQICPRNLSLFTSSACAACNFVVPWVCPGYTLVIPRHTQGIPGAYPGYTPGIPRVCLGMTGSLGMAGLLGMAGQHFHMASPAPGHPGPGFQAQA